MGSPTNRRTAYSISSLAMAGAALAAFTTPPWSSGPRMVMMQEWQAYSNLVPLCQMACVPPPTNTPSPSMGWLTLVTYKAKLLEVIAAGFVCPTNPINPTNGPVWYTVSNVLVDAGAPMDYFGNTPPVALSVSSNGLGCWTQIVARLTTRAIVGQLATNSLEYGLGTGAGTITFITNCATIMEAESGWNITYTNISESLFPEVQREVDFPTDIVYCARRITTSTCDATTTDDEYSVNVSDFTNTCSSNAGCVVCNYYSVTNMWNVWCIPDAAGGSGFELFDPALITLFRSAPDYIFQLCSTAETYSSSEFYYGPRAGAGWTNQWDSSTPFVSNGVWTLCKTNAASSGTFTSHVWNVSTIPWAGETTNMDAYGEVTGAWLIVHFNL